MVISFLKRRASSSTVSTVDVEVALNLRRPAMTVGGGGGVGWGGLVKHEKGALYV